MMEGIGMSIRVSFWLGAEDGICSHFLSAPLDQFEEWASDTEAEFPKEVGTEVLDLIRDVRCRGAAALQTTDSVRAAELDRMLDMFYGFFCDFGPGQELLDYASPSIVSVRRYRAATDLLRRAELSSETLKLWEFLIGGRPVLRNAEALPYTSEDGVFHLSYWTFAECSHLLPEMAKAAKWDGAKDGKPYSSARPFSERGMLHSPIQIGREGHESNGRGALDLALEACARAIGEKVGLIITVA
jgi:hypothetical protein